MNVFIVKVRRDLCRMLLLAFGTTFSLSQAPAQSYGLDALQPIGKFLGGVLPATTPGQNGVGQPPSTLSATGAFSDLGSLTTRSGLIEYDVNSPLWTDGAAKKRWLAIPNDGVADAAAEKIGFSETGAWQFPKGSVLVKQFDLPVSEANPSVLRRMETRFLVHGDDGVYYGVTYRWREDGMDADLLLDGEDANITITTAAGGTKQQVWSFPSRADCRSCHNTTAGHVLGPRTHQMNRDLLYMATGRTDNQLRALNHLGLFSPALNESAIGGFARSVAVTDTAHPLETRVRSYVDANCSHCHQPGNLATTFDARFTTALDSQNLINGPVLYDLGIADARVIAPQSLEQSIMHRRLSVVGLHQMPPIGRNTVDEAAVATLRDWIMTLPVDEPDGGNRAPVAYDDESTTTINTPVEIAIMANDADGDALILESISAVTNGSHQILAGGVIRFTPASAFTGVAGLSYTVQDGRGGTSNTARLTVQVVPAVTSNSVQFLDASSRLANSSWASGVAMGVADMNADGRDDIVHMKEGFDLRIQYQPAGGSSFTALDLGRVSSQRQWSLSLGDADNNGYPDILTGGYYDGLSYFRANANGSGYAKTLLSSPSIFSQATSFADINDDGWLDFFACHDEGENAKFRNLGNGVMTRDDALIDTRTTPVSDNSGNYGVVWSDYDNDGDIDMYLSKCRQGVSSSSDPRRINKLMRNNGDGTFTDVAPSLGMAFGEQSWAADFGDIDNDGDLDCFVGNHAAPSYLMRNNGNGTFTNISSAAGISSITWMIIQNVFRDFNNDGWVDLLLTGQKHELWLNNRNGTFTLAANPFGLQGIESCAVGDLNRDGFTDVYAGYASLYNAPNTAKPDKLFLSTPNGNGFYSITLQGVRSNRNGSGARIELQGPWGTQVREVRSGESYGVTHSFTQIFGMGNAGIASRLKVRWPSGVVDEAANVRANQFVTLKEGATAPPNLINPGPETGTVGNQVQLAISASDPTNDALVFSSLSLPPGLVVNPATGVISGTLTTAGLYDVTLSVTDGWSTVATVFEWRVNARPVAPTVMLSTVSGTVAGPFEVTATFSDEVTSVEMSDFQVVNGTAASLTGAGRIWKVTVTPAAAGVVTVFLPAGSTFGPSGLGNLASNTLPVTFAPVNVVSPTVTLSSERLVYTTQTFAINAVFSEAVSGGSWGFQVTNGSVLGVSGTGTLWVATIQASQPGPVTVALPAGAASTPSGGQSLASNTLTLRYDPAEAFRAFINFQPMGAERPEGYVDDVGEVFGARNGMAYGWNISQAVHARKRRAATEQRSDTLIRMQPGARWELAVPSGRYRVEVAAGDPVANSGGWLDVEGTPVYQVSALRPTAQGSQSTVVTVEDGRLTLNRSASLGSAMALRYVHVIAEGLVAEPAMRGFAADYFHGTSFQQRRFSRVDPAVDFNWGPGLPDARVSPDGFSVRWEGWVLPRYTETYTFITTSDDGVRLWVNGQLLVDQWNDHGTLVHGGNITLQAGVRAQVRMEYYERTGHGVARLEWESPSELRQIIPAERVSVSQDGSSPSTYPATFDEWKLTAAGDGLLYKYALALPAGSGVQDAEQVRIERRTTAAGEQMVLVVLRPVNVSDVVYSVEHSSDLAQWQPVNVSPVVANRPDGTQIMEWQNLQSAVGLSPDFGIVRLRLSHTSGATGVSEPRCWQRIGLNTGINTIGPNLLRQTVLTAAVTGIQGQRVLLGESAPLGLMLDPDVKHYLEVISGPHAGHRFELLAGETGSVLVDGASPNNTLAALPSDLTGALVAMRPHQTLERMLDLARFGGSLSPAVADQVMFYEAGHYRISFFLDGGAARPEWYGWTTLDDATLASTMQTSIAPGVAMISKRRSASNTLVMTGVVRTGAFVQKLAAGNNLIANPWPLSLSPEAAGLTAANGFTTSRSTTKADKIQVWGGDWPALSPMGGLPKYAVFWYANVGATPFWTRADEATLLSYTAFPLLQGGRGTYLNLQPSSVTSPWRWKVPGASSGPSVVMR